VALFTQNPEIFGLSLCAGLGGLELGLHIAEPRYRTVCYVERNAYAAATLVARMADKSLCDAPVWDDVTTFDARQWRGTVDILTAGYPCQPFSSSGFRKGDTDPRHLWPYIAKIIQDCQPKRIFCENVEGHVDLGLPDVIRDLQNLGYRVKAGLFSAYECGAAHHRRRLFIMADANSIEFRHEVRFQNDINPNDILPEPQYEREPDRSDGSCKKLDNGMAVCESFGPEADRAILPLFAPAPCDYSAWARIAEINTELQPCIFGLGYGLAYGLERHHAAGNGVVPLAAALAYSTLSAA